MPRPSCSQLKAMCLPTGGVVRCCPAFSNFRSANQKASLTFLQPEDWIKHFFDLFLRCVFGVAKPYFLSLEEEANFATAMEGLQNSQESMQKTENEYANAQNLYEQATIDFNNKYVAFQKLEEDQATLQERIFNYHVHSIFEISVRN